MVAQTYVVTENGIGEDGRDKKNDVVGYITLTCSEIDLENGYQIADCQYANRYPTMPALKIARLAVDCRHRNKGIGELLVGMALAIAQDEIAPSAGCRFVVTDAKQDAVGFYERQGFTRIDSEANLQREQPVMFVDLQINDDE